MAKGIRNKRKRKYEILTNSYKDFILAVIKSEQTILEKILTLIYGFKTDDDDRIKRQKENQRLINKLDKVIDEGWSESNFSKNVVKFTKDIDEIEKLSKEIIAHDNGIDFKELNKKVDVSNEKAAYIEQITKGLLSKDALDAQVQIPLKRVLYRHATTGIKLKDAEKEIRDFLLGNGKGGKLASRSRFYAVESIQRLNGLINKKACDQYELNVFRIVNPLIKTSEQICIDMIQGSGELGKLAVAPRTFLVEDIPEIIRIGKRDGFIEDNVTPETYFIYRNHFGCIHDFICTKRSESWVKQKKRERDKRNSK